VQAASSENPVTTPAPRRAMLGGDRFYALARWFVLFLLFTVSPLLIDVPIWPPRLDASPTALLIWGYALFSMFATVALFLSPTTTVRSLTFLVDIAFFSLLNFFSSRADLFYPLYFLPVIGAAMQMSPRAGLWFGIAASLAFGASYMGGRVGPGNGSVPRDALGLVALALRGLVLVFVPWLAGGLAERTGLLNRESVAEAEREARRAWREAESYRDQMRSLYEVAYTLSTTMNYQSVLDVTLVESRKLVPYSAALVLLSTGQPDELYIAAAQGLGAADQEHRVRVDRGALSQALRSGEPALVADISQEPPLQPITALRRCRAACLVPLRAALQTYGLMLIASDQEGAFDNEQLGMVTALANYAIIALHNAQLVHDLRAERAKLLSKEEDVRHQLARDLHDGPAQALAAITMNLEFIRRLLERDPARVPQELEKLVQLAKRTTYEVRTMLFELRPLALETQGLDVTLEQYFERFKGNGAEIVLEADKITAGLDTKTEGTLFNIIQESVNNALKHAQARHIWVRIRQTPNALETTVQDDGRGFDLQKVLASYDQRGSFGLLNIEERAKLIGGFAELHSAPGEGTTVRVIVPLE
jgi:signal transduction histidine kinase